jgi:cold shock protein
VVKAMRKSPDEMVPIVEDLIKLMDVLEGTYRRGRHPDQKTAHKLATVMRRVADDLEG